MKKIIIVVISFFFFFFMGIKAEAMEEGLAILEESQIRDIEKSVNQSTNGMDISFKDLVLKLISGEQKFDLEYLGSILSDALFSEINENKATVLSVIMIAVIGVIFTNFANAFESHQIADVSFYVIYLLIMVLLVNSFSLVINVAANCVENLLDFMRVVIPAYCMTVALAAGSTTAVIFYEFTLLLIIIVQWAIKNIVIPLISIYVIISLVNCLSKEDLLSRMAALLKKAIETILKSLLALVISFNVIQGLIAPAVDSLKTSMITKTISAIPGIGNAVNAVTDVVIGSGVLIKNGVGVAALIIIVVICFIPMMKLGVFSFLYKLASSLIQPMADKRMLNAIECVGDGAALLFRAVFTSLVLFIITIAVVTASTSLR